jgi:hypothetical protein
MEEQNKRPAVTRWSVIPRKQIDTVGRRDFDRLHHAGQPRPLQTRRLWARGEEQLTLKNKQDCQRAEIGDENDLDESNGPAPQQAAHAATPCRLRKSRTAAGPPNSSKFV